MVLELGYLNCVLKMENSKVSASSLFNFSSSPGIFPALAAAMNKPKTIMLWGAAAVAVVGALSFPSASSGQAAGDEPAIAQLVNEIAEQHNKIVANQQAIDVKVSAVAETLRIARIFVSRGGGKK